MTADGRQEAGTSLDGAERKASEVGEPGILQGEREDCLSEGSPPRGRPHLPSPGRATHARLEGGPLAEVLSLTTTCWKLLSRPILSAWLKHDPWSLTAWA